ncbi:DUF998 domain-containing protein [Rhodococcus sp. ACPA1]|uniref:DUF998 domain-containing protein n=1 Tax=Rhodococcus sp. ACPA1 TaxID=2028572 RepID=UPI000BB14A7D|nr:DUF998 domain-containing protein [Rhodococcus sp. ACPA1]PBC55514.1 hypothetical protein CJ177_21400 [Rhodococcus sp. ACPA1]
MTSRGRVAVAALLILGAVGYASWLLEFVLDTGIDPLRGFASELAAADQPYGFWFRSGDLLTGCIVAVAGVLGLSRYSQGWVTAVGWIALIVFALATIADSRLPMSCAATNDPVCAASEAAGHLPLTHDLHAVTSASASTGGVVSSLAFLLAAFRCQWPTWLKITGVAVATVFVGGTVWTLTAAGLRGEQDAWLGLGQRVQLLAFCGWLTFVALSVIHVTPERAGST